MPQMTTSPYRVTESARRSAQNRAYAALALEHLDPADPTLAWLFPAGKPPRQKVLEELGRIAIIDEDSCRQCTIELCASPPKTTHAGAAQLRRLRLGTRPPPEKSDEFEVLLHMALAELLDERPDTPVRLLKATAGAHRASQAVDVSLKTACHRKVVLAEAPVPCGGCVICSVR